MVQEVGVVAAVGVQDEAQIRAGVVGAVPPVGAHQIVDDGQVLQGRQTGFDGVPAHASGGTCTGGMPVVCVGPWMMGSYFGAGKGLREGASGCPEEMMADMSSEGPMSGS